MQRVGVIGLGPIGNRHANIYGELDNAELAGVCDVDRERADAAAARLGVRAFYSVQELLDGAELDMASVATGGKEYGSDHYQPTVEALEGGLHVLVEKPISNEIGPAEEMVALAREKGLCFGVDLNHRFTPAARLARQWMEWGVEPTAMLGHSIGEYPAACLSGVFSLSDAISIVAARGRAMADAPRGARIKVRRLCMHLTHPTATRARLHAFPRFCMHYHSYILLSSYLHT